MSFVEMVSEDLASWIEIPRFSGTSGGLLSAIEFAQLPFTPSRVFYITDVPAGGVRGEHGHRYGQQILICLTGSIRIELRYRDTRQTTVITPDSPGLVLESNVWARQTYLDKDSSLLVLCSHPYDPASYISQNESPENEA